MIVNHMKSISKKSLIKILVYSIFILCAKSLKAQSLNEIDLAINVKIDSIISLLTIEEKIAMCHAQSKLVLLVYQDWAFQNYGCLMGHTEFVQK